MDKLEFNSEGLSLIGIDKNHPAWGLIGQVYVFNSPVQVGEIVVIGVEEDNGVDIGPSKSLKYTFKAVYWGSGLSQAHKLRLVGMKLMRVAVEEGGKVKERIEVVWVFIQPGYVVRMSLPGPNRVGFTNCVAIPARLMPIRVRVRQVRAGE